MKPSFNYDHDILNITFLLFHSVASVTADGEASKMKLIASAVILCCLVHVYSGCGLRELGAIKRDCDAAFGDDKGRLREVAQEFYDRSAPLQKSTIVHWIYQWQIRGNRASATRIGVLQRLK